MPTTYYHTNQHIDFNNYAVQSTPGSGTLAQSIGASGAITTFWVAEAVGVAGEWSGAYTQRVNVTTLGSSCSLTTCEFQRRNPSLAAFLTGTWSSTTGPGIKTGTVTGSLGTALATDSFWCPVGVSNSHMMNAENFTFTFGSDSYQEAPWNLAAYAGSGALSGAGSLSSSGVAVVPVAVRAATPGSLAARPGLMRPSAGFFPLPPPPPPEHSGSVALSGVGTLAATGVPRPTGAAALAGTGTLAATGVPRPTGAASLSGAGTLGGVGAPSVDRAGGLSGVGSLAATFIPRPTGSAALAGSGTLTAAMPAMTASGTAALSGVGSLTATGTGTPAHEGSAAFSGTGTLSGAGVPRPTGAGALAGTGALSGAGVPRPTGSAGLAGAGTLGASGSPHVARSGALSGAGTLTVAGVPRPTGAAGLSGAGTLTATAVPSPASAAGLSGTGTLAATGTPRPTGAAGLSGVGTLTAAGTPRPTGTAALAGAGSLTGTGVQGFAVTGGLAGTGTFWAGTLAVPGTAALLPDAILASAGLSGSLADLADDPASPDGAWLLATTTSPELRVSFPSPPDGPLAGTQTVRVLVRAGA